MTTPPLSTSAARPRLGGLDGLRAIAVGLVVVYHLFPDALPGGFLGVDVFFVISGFLITTLLLTEHRERGRIDLVAFWRRRARRLLPALAIVLLVCTSLAALLSYTVGGADLLVNASSQIAGAAFFVANWVYVALGSDYFAQGDPELFRNMWSLAIEEQFYVVLPLVLLLALRMRSRATRVVFFGVFGIASAVWMAVLFLAGAPATRVYFGTDSHVFGLLLGVALACALRPGSLSAREIPLRAWQQVALLVAGATGLALLGYLACTVREGGPESFTGAFQFATFAVLVVVWAATRPGAWLGRALDVQPLRWIGERSYGIYLWHWPLLLLVGSWVSAGVASTAGLAGWADDWLVPILTLLLTLACAALSHRYIEQPIRALGLRRAVLRAMRPARLHGRSLAVGVSVLAILVVTVPVTGVAIATAPVQTTARADSGGAEAVARGEAALAGAGRGLERAQARDTNDRPTADAAATDTNGFDTPEGFSTEWAKDPVYTPPPPEPIESWQIFALGDSVMLASAPELVEAFPDIWIDAAVSRGLAAGVGIAEDLAAQGQLREVLVVGLGTNGPIDDADLEALLRVAGEDPRIVLVNAYGDRWWIPEVNAQLEAFAEAHRGVTLADWEAAIAEVPDGLAGDEIHPNPSGGVAYAEAVQEALDELITRREQPRNA